MVFDNGEIYVSIRMMTKLSTKTTDPLVGLLVTHSSNRITLLQLLDVTHNKPQHSPHKQRIDR
jgi:hypothetical protein